MMAFADADVLLLGLPGPTTNHSLSKRSIEEESSSMFYCFMFFFLLTSLICGLVMAVVGGANLSTCPGSSVPSWLLVEGLAACAVLAVLGSGNMDTCRNLRMVWSLVLIIFLCIWSVCGIHWSYTRGVFKYYISKMRVFRLI